jgi:hypothetical protein
MRAFSKIKAVGFISATGAPTPSVTVIANGKIAYPSGGTNAGCGATGTDWPTPDFEFSDNTQGWQAGGGTACMGILSLPLPRPSKKELFFGFGSFYGAHPNDVLKDGDSYTLTIDGISHSGTVSGV